MARETKAEREAREQREYEEQQRLLEKQREERRLKREQKKAEAAAAAAAVNPTPAQTAFPETITVVIDFSEPVKHFFNNLFGDKIQLVSAAPTYPLPSGGIEQVIAKSIADKANAAKAAETPAVQNTQEEEAPIDEQEEVSLTTIREMISAKAGQGKTANIVALLKKHGASNASTLEPSEYAAFYKALMAL